MEGSPVCHGHYCHYCAAIMIVKNNISNNNEIIIKSWQDFLVQHLEVSFCCMSKLLCTGMLLGTWLLWSHDLIALTISTFTSQPSHCTTAHTVHSMDFFFSLYIFLFFSHTEPSGAHPHHTDWTHFKPKKKHNGLFCPFHNNLQKIIWTLCMADKPFQLSN